MLALLANHTHKTARAEMAYALLVEGQGPYGSAFSPDDFRDLEVRDTDGDGLPEFVDAWGEPIQFYRWPIFYRVRSRRRGTSLISRPLASASRPASKTRSTRTRRWSTRRGGRARFNDSSPFASASLPLSGAALFFQTAFHSLTDPNAYTGLNPKATAGQLWDRGSLTSPYIARRAFYSRFLVLSGGPDKIPGVPVYDPSYYTKLADYYTGTWSPDRTRRSRSGGVTSMTASSSSRSRSRTRPRGRPLLGSTRV